MHPRDDQGRLAPEQVGEQTSYEEKFRKVWKLRGLPQEQIDTRWQLYLHEQKLRSEWERAGLGPEQIGEHWKQWLKEHPRALEGVWE